MRIHVERGITRIKKFKPLNHILLTLHRSVYQVWTVLWILCNFLPHLIEQLSKLENWNKHEELEHYLFIYVFIYSFIYLFIYFKYATKAVKTVIGNQYKCSRNFNKILEKYM